MQVIPSSTHANVREVRPAPRSRSPSTNQRRVRTRTKSPRCRLPRPDVIRNQQVDARQAKRLPERQELIGIEANPRPERCLEEVPVARRSGAPRQSF